MFTTIILLSAVAPFVSAFAYPENVPLEKRQAPGTPQYDCHENCGKAANNLQDTSRLTDRRWSHNCGTNRELL